MAVDGKAPSKIGKRPDPTLAMKAVFRTFLDQAGDAPFRRSAISDRLYPLTKPRNRERADAMAELLIRIAAKAGKVERHGHLHWKIVQMKRTLKSGREVAASDRVQQLALETRCPGKWAAVDLETGEIWQGTPSGWKRPSSAFAKEVKACLS